MASCTTEPDEQQALPTLVEFPTEAGIAETEPADDGEEITPIVTEQPATDENPDGFVTQEVESPTQSSLVTEEAAATSDVFVPAESVRYQNEDSTLFVVVTTLTTAEMNPNMPEPPVGEKFVMLSTNFANFTGEPLTIEADSLTLIDQQFNRYPPVQPEEYIRIPLYGTELPGEVTLQGAVRFALPEDATPYLLEWCPYNDCEVETLQTFMP
ncbi:MAG: hypothetical protein ACFE0Q_14030 [Anaerolineae bacterium]